MIKEINNICCIGAGYVGGPSMAVLSDHCHNIKVTVVDIDERRIKNWNSTNPNDMPVYEPGLNEIIERRRGKNLFFTTNIQRSIEDADMVFISVNTPTKSKGLGAGQASDLKWIEESARTVAKYAKNHTIVVEKSTIPVRTGDVIKAILSTSIDNEKKSNPTYSILSNPEFLSEGSAINDLKNPDRVLIGGEENQSVNLLADIYSNWIAEDKIIRTNLWSSELSKLTANAFLAQRISSINSISGLCELTGADINEVAKAVGTDSRIGPKFLKPGPGFGGSCFKKDLLNLVYLSEYFGLKEVSEYWRGVLSLNEWQKKRIVKIIVDKLFGTLSGKKIVILGFSFKENTNDTRESSAIDIVKNLIQEGAEVIIHDPKVRAEQIERDLGTKNNKELLDNKIKDKSIHGSWVLNLNLYETFNNSDAALILTAWEDYKHINWDVVSKKMRKPAWIFDTRSIINNETFKKTNLKLWQLGNGFL